MEIRREHLRDHAAVRALHRAAFARSAITGADVPEAQLTDQLREGPWWLPHLSLVAVSGGGVIGHVIASRAVVEPSGAPALGLGPLGVAPEEQRRGVGTALMHAVLGAAQATDESLVGLLGDPAFYRRFGFVRADENGVTPPDPAWAAAFQVRMLSEPTPTGSFRYAEPFEHIG